MINPEKQALLLIEQRKENQSGIASVKRNKSGPCLYEIIWNDITANTWEPLENLAPRLSEFKEYDCLCVCRVLPLTHSGTQRHAQLNWWRILKMKKSSKKLRRQMLIFQLEEQIEREMSLRMYPN